MKNFEKAFASTLEIACKEEYFDTIETPAKKGWDEAKWEPTMFEPIDYIGQEKERISLLLPEARKGNVRAMSELGFLFLEYTNDVRAAVYWLSKAAKRDDAEALWHLASCYSDRRHKQCDARASLKLLKRAARQGHVPSMRRLGLYYEQAFSVPYDAKKAAGYYAQAAKQGDFESLYRLGRLYYMGRDIERDYAKAFELFSQAAAHPFAADSQIRDELLFHDEGTQFKHDWHEVHEYVPYFLGLCFFHGRGTKRDVKQAAEWFQKAKENGNPHAQTMLKKCRDAGIATK